MSARGHPGLEGAELDDGQLIAQLPQELLACCTLADDGNGCGFSRLEFDADFDGLKTRSIAQKVAKCDGLGDAKRRS